MKQEKKPQAAQKPTDEQLLETIFCSSSATDCTGLIPTAPTSHAEEENYNEMYTFLPSPTVDHDKKERSHPTQKSPHNK